MGEDFLGVRCDDGARGKWKEVEESWFATLKAKPDLWRDFTVEKENKARPENAYEAAIQAQERVLERGRKGKVVVRDEERPWENTRQGRIRYFLHPDMYPDTVLQEWRVFSQEIPAQSGKHRHQGGVAIYILEGKGYTIADGVRYDWEKGDLVTLPVKPGGVEHQHFNTNPAGPSRWMAFVYLPLANHVALHLKQIEVAPGHSSKGRDDNDG